MANGSVYIKNARKLEPGEAKALHAILSAFVKRHSRQLGIVRMSVDADVHMKDGWGGKDKRRKFSLKAVLYSKSGKKRAASSAWGLAEAAKIVEASLVKQARREKGRKTAVARSKRRLLK